MMLANVCVFEFINYLESCVVITMYMQIFYKPLKKFMNLVETLCKVYHYYTTVEMQHCTLQVHCYPLCIPLTKLLCSNNYIATNLTYICFI